MTKEQLVREALHKVVQTPEGFLVAQFVLESLGAFQPVVGETPVALRNAGEDFFDVIAEVNPEAALRLFAAVRGVLHIQSANDGERTE